MKKKQVSIYVATHKKFISPNLKGYIPIQVGKQFANVDLKYISDDVGQNIAAKNKSYCELTALYWIWKNDVYSDIVGICHYRRYLTRSLLSINRDRSLTIRQIRKLLKKYDMIVPDTIYYGEDTNIKDKWIICNNHEIDLIHTRNVLKELFPEYVESYDNVLASHEAHFYNIMIAEKKIVNKYCEWLFAICSELEKRIDMTGYDSTQTRFFGLISEILLDVWCDYNQISRCYCRLMQTEDEPKKQRKDAIRRIRNNLFKK